MNSSGSVRSAKTLQNAFPVVLSAEKNREDRDDAMLFINFKIENGSALCDVTQPRRNVGRQRALMRRSHESLKLSFNSFYSRFCVSEGIGKGLAQSHVRLDQMIVYKIEVVFERGGTHNLKGHNELFLPPSQLLCARALPRDSRTRRPSARQLEPSVPQSQLPSALSPREEVPARVGSPRSRSKSARLQQAFGQRRPAAQKSKRMFSRPSDITPYSTYIYHSVAPPSINGGAP
jgi:hypothetical protein